jgi:glycosyltransferase involved in cell wall biosynthesis
MAAGLPVLAPKYAHEVMSIVDAEQCGMPVDFEDPADIERAMLYLWANPGVCREMGKRGREAFCLRHNWEREFQPVLARIKSWEEQEYGDKQQPL